MEMYSPRSKKHGKFLFFAPAGHGKTVLLGTAQEDERTYPMCFLDFEAGTESLDGLDIDVIPIRSWNDADKAIEALEGGDIVKIDGRKVDFAEYRSVGIDSVSEWNRWSQLERLRVKGKSRNDPDLIELQDYNVTSVQLRRVLRRLRDLPLYVFFSGHAKTLEDPRLGRVTLPDLSGQLAEEIAGLVSVSGYLALSSDEDVDYNMLLLHDYPKYRVKARSPWKKPVPTEILDPDITEILDQLGYTRNGGE